MKRLFFILAILAILICIILFLYIFNASFQGKNILEEVTYEPIDNYVVKEIDGRKVIENENVGLELRVPDGWGVEKFVGTFVDKSGNYENAIIISSPDAEIDPAINIPKKGCGLSLSVEYRYSEEKYQDLYHLIIDLQENSGDISEDYKIIEISEKPALWEVFFDDDVFGKAILVSLPVEEKVFVFETIIIPEEKDRCLSEFTNILEEVTIL